MSLPYPKGAEQIAEARANGMRPEGPVIVVLHGQPEWDNAMVYANPAFPYRWDWVRGLPSVVVLIGKDTKLGRTLIDIEESGPDQLDVIDTDRGLGWMVLFTKPRLRTVSWPAMTVADWLGDQAWHKALNAEKARHGLEVA